VYISDIGAVKGLRQSLSFFKLCQTLTEKIITAINTVNLSLYPKQNAFGFKVELSLQSPKINIGFWD